MSDAGIEAVSWVLLTNVVDRSLPFQRAAEPETKLEPFTVKVKAGPPAVALEGDKDVKLGTRLVIVNVTALEVPPPGEGLKTVTLAEPAVATSAAAIVAVNRVLLINVVILLPAFHWTVEALTKPVPLTVSENAPPPAVAEAGLRLVIAGTGLSGVLIVKVWATDVPPPAED